MMAALAGVVKEDDKDIARKMFKAGDINKQVDEVSKIDYTDSRGGGVPSRKNRFEVWGSLPKNLILFKTKICNFLYPILDLTKNSIACFRPVLLSYICSSDRCLRHCEGLSSKALSIMMKK